MLRRCALFVLVACNQSSPAPSTSSPPPAPLPTSCSDVTAHMRTAMTANKAGGSAQVAMVDRMLAVVAAACEEDAWPEEARACVVASTDRPSLDACQAKLPVALRDKLSERMRPVVESTATH